MMVRQMSDKEILKAQLMAQLEAGSLRQKEVAARLGLSVRQVRRLMRAYQERGTAGLVSRRRGQPSNRRIKSDVLSQALALIGAHYADFGPTLAAEKLRERHALALAVETVRTHMIAAGYWKPRRGAMVRAHPLRERRPRRGELIQIDGSPHDWFEGRAKACCLLVFIDDATGELMECQFVASETTLGYLAALQRYIPRHGIPAALYSDRHSIFRVNAKEAASEAQTQFGRALATLGIEAIQANSPQAKGRVERAHQTLQDRLVKEMRLQGISDPQHANAWLPIYMAEHNRRFAVAAAQANDAHVRYLGTHKDLERILSVHTPRRLSKNLSCQVDGRLLQIQTEGAGLGLRGAQVTVHRHTDGRTEIIWRGRNLAFAETDQPVRQAPPVAGKEVNAKVQWALDKRKGVPQAADHPWKKWRPQPDPAPPPAVALLDHRKRGAACKVVGS